MNEKTEFIKKPNFKDPESFGTASDPKKEGAPFEKAVTAKLDKDMPASKKTAKNAADLDDVKKLKDKSQGSVQDAKDVLGNSVATQKPKGGKTVKLKEDIDEFEVDDYDIQEGAQEIGSMYEEDEEQLDEISFSGLKNVGNFFGNKAKQGAQNVANKVGDVVGGAYDKAKQGVQNLGNQISTQYNTGVQKDTANKIQQMADKLKAEIERLNAVTVKAGGQPISVASVIATLSNQLRGSKGADMSKYRSEGKSGYSEEDIMEAVGKCFESANKKASLDKLAENILKTLKEENYFGKHPSYQKPAFTTPETGEAYGKKIGNSAPFKGAPKSVDTKIKGEKQQPLEAPKKKFDEAEGYDELIESILMKLKKKD